MRNFKKCGITTIAVILTILIALLLPVQVFADTIPKQEQAEAVTFDSLNEPTETANIVCELTERRDEFTKHFRMDDGTIMAVSYGSPVHYKNNKGKWVEYDNSLVGNSEATPDEAINEVFTNKKSNVDIEISPDTFSGNLVNISTKKGDISWEYSGTKKTTAKIKNNSNKKHKGNEKFTSIDTLISQAEYNGIYKDVDLECIVSTNGVKENIILKSADTQNEFEIEYNIKGFTPKQIDEKTIELHNKKGKTVYTITAPCMYDADGNESTDLSMKILSKKGNKLKVKLVADRGFINSWGRAFPVTIDPEVSVSGSSKTMTAQVNSANKDAVQRQQTHFYIGKSSSSGVYSGLIKSDSIENDFVGKNIVSAKVSIFPFDAAHEMEIDAYPITSYWTNNTATYNNVKYNSDIIDYATTEVWTTNVVTFDITKTFKQWCNGELDNNGIYLKSDDTCSDFGGYACYLSKLLPRFIVKYKEYTGSESNLTSHAVDCGQNAEASVCDYTGNLVFKQFMYEEKGERFSYNLYSTYHSARNSDDEGIGEGWHLSFSQSVSILDGYYSFLDGDGVVHYFKIIDGDTILSDEDNLGYSLTIKNNIIEIDDGSVTKTFGIPSDNNAAYIKSEIDNVNDKNVIEYTYASNNYLKTIKTTIGTYTINYASTSDGSKCIGNISLPNSNKVSFVYFTNTNKLSRVRFESGKSSYFNYTVYSAEGLLKGVRQDGESNGNILIWEYNGKNQINKIMEYGKDKSIGNYLDISYGDNTTIFTDRDGRKLTYTFDNYGNTISKLNANGYIENTNNFFDLSVSGGSDSYTKNYIDISSEPGTIASGQYYYKTDGAIGSETSSGGTITVDSSASRLGQKSIKVSHTSSSQFFTTATHQFSVGNFAGKTVTFSSYVKLQNIVKGSRSGVAGAILKIKCFNSGGTSLLDQNSGALLTTLSGAEWQRLCLTVTIPAGTSYYRIYCGLRNAQGTAWFDCLQLEEGEVMNDYNALANSDFATTSSWKIQGGGNLSFTNGKPVIFGTGGGIPYVESSDLEDYDNENDTDDENNEGNIGATTCVTATEYEDYDTLVKTDSYGNTLNEQQGRVIRTVKKYYLTENSGNESDLDDTDSDVWDDTTTEQESSVMSDKFIYQTVPINQRGVCFNISGTVTAKSIPLSTSDRTFGIALKITYIDNTTEDHYQSFNSEFQKEQSVALSITPNNTSKVVKSVDFAFVYGHNKNSMTVKNAMLNFGYTEYNLDCINFGGTTDEDPGDNEEDSDESSEDNCIDYEVVSEKIDKTSPYLETSTNYDSTGNYVTSEVDESGNTTSYEYDIYGNMSKITDPNGVSTSYSYDSHGNILSIVNGS